MTPVRQLPQHCAIACLVSALEDKRHAEMQRKIVRNFPSHCHAGEMDEGVVPAVEDFEALVKGLGLAKDVTWLMQPDEIIPALQKLIPLGANIFIKTTFPFNHCVRAMSVATTGILVMNPEVGYELWDWARIEKSKSVLAVLGEE